MNSNPTYPTCKISASQEAAIATALRSLMNSNGFTNTKIVAFDHNWDAASSYPIQSVSLLEVSMCINVILNQLFSCKPPLTRSPVLPSTATAVTTRTSRPSSTPSRTRRSTSPSALVLWALTGGATSRCVAGSVLPPVSISYTFVLSGTWTTCELASASRSDTCPAPFLTTRRDTDLSARSNTTRTMG